MAARAVRVLSSTSRLSAKGLGHAEVVARWVLSTYESHLWALTAGICPI